MFRMCASNSHSYTHLIQALGIVRKPTVWVFITSKYLGTHDIGLPIILRVARVSQSTHPPLPLDSSPPAPSVGNLDFLSSQSIFWASTP